MGAFCVFGVSKQALRKKAERLVPTHMKIDGARMPLTAPEWGAKVAVMVDELFASSDKQVKISPEYDAPQFCVDWMSAAPLEIKSAKIMCKGDKIDKHGARIIKKGAVVQTWVAYDPANIPPPPL